MAENVWIDWGLGPDAADLDRFPLGVELSGARFEQGLQHGRALREVIAANSATVRAMVDAVPGRARRARYEHLLAQAGAFIERETSHLHDEINGISAGSGLPYRDVLELNQPLFMGMANLPDECSQLVLTPSRAGRGRTLHAKTRDMSGPFLQQVVLRRTDDDGERMAEVGVAGSVTWPGSGINSYGVALSTSGVWAPTDRVDWSRAADSWLGTPSHHLLKGARHAGEVLDRVRVLRRVKGVNMCVSDADGRAVSMEIGADDVRVLGERGDGWLVATNHRVGAEAAASATSTPASTLHRRSVACGALGSAEGWTPASLAGLLASHDGYPNDSLCRHQVGGSPSRTTYASVAVLPELRFHVVLDNPCAALDHLPDA